MVLATASVLVILVAGLSAVSLFFSVVLRAVMPNGLSPLLLLLVEGRPEGVAGVAIVELRPMRITPSMSQSFMQLACTDRR